MRQLFLVLGLFCLSFQSEHKFYMSLTEIAFEKEDEALEISSRFFLDDVERAISDGEDITKINESMDSAILPHIRQFYTNGLDIGFDGKRIAYDFIGYEVEGDLLWCYAEADLLSIPKQIEVKSTWLQEDFAEQINIINLLLDEPLTAHLNKEKPSEKFDLE